MLSVIDGVVFYFLIDLLKQIICGQKKYVKKSFKEILSYLASVPIMALILYCIYNIPYALFDGISWHFIESFGPINVKYATIALFVCFSLIYVYSLISLIFSNKEDSNFRVLGCLTVIIGFGNTFSVFIINEAVRRGIENADSLVLYFVAALILYVYSTKIIRTIVVELTNKTVYEKRISLINKILSSQYQKYEKIESGRIQSGLNNDTNNISLSVNVFTNLITSAVSLLFCFVYLAFLSLYGVIISVITIIIAGSIFYYFSMRANKFLVEARELQDVFFRFINNLMLGFKNLSLDKAKCNGFKEDMQESCADFRIKNTEANKRFVNVYVIGEILTMLVIGSVIFILPKVVTGMSTNDIRSYVFVFMYMSGPVRVLLDSIPQYMFYRVSWSKIKELEEDLLGIEKNNNTKSITRNIKDNICIDVNNLVFTYYFNEKGVFSVGPISCSFKSGEVTFITGGNGSGKSTFGKLLTGLYTPDEGEISIDGDVKNSVELGEYFTTIFSDYHVFDKLYGIDHSKKKESITKYLKLLNIHDKVKVKDGVFDTLDLSSGQKKRLALMISYLEDKPVFFFDEWAADQDPHFRKFFYEELLPELKLRNKCVIAITHDDRYFDLADQVINFEMGKTIGESSVKPA